MKDILFMLLEIIAIIPARGGSKGIPRKNLRLLAGKPLVVHTIGQALAGRICDPRCGIDE